VTKNRCTFRPAAWSDVPALARFEKRVFTSYYAPHRFSQTDFEHLLRRSSTIAWVVESQTRLVGYALGQGPRVNASIARLDSIAVDQAWRRTGIGAKLIRRFIRMARRRGAAAVVLEVAAKNHRAIGLFAGLGFTPVRRLPAYYAPDVDGILMRRQLIRAVRRVSSE
jgi:ribosomal-protein-alanine N-acetyltransferase